MIKKEGKRKGTNTSKDNEAFLKEEKISLAKAIYSRRKE